MNVTGEVEATSVAAPTTVSSGMDGWVDGLEDADSDAGKVLIRENTMEWIMNSVGESGRIWDSFFSCALLCLHSATKSLTLKGTLGVREEGFSCNMPILL